MACAFCVRSTINWLRPTSKTEVATSAMHIAPTMVMAASFEAIERFENRLSNFDIGTGPVGAALERADHALGSDRDAKTQSLRSDSRSFHALVMTMLMSWAVKGGFMRTPREEPPGLVRMLRAAGGISGRAGGAAPARRREAALAMKKAFRSAAALRGRDTRRGET